MIAVLLAGGRGTRLVDLEDDTPKPLVLVSGVTVIDRILDTLAHDGFEDVVVVTGHRADDVERHLASRPGVRYARQHEPRGTADALLAARSGLGDEPYLVTWADVIVEPGVYAAVALAATSSDAAVAVNHLDDLSAGGQVSIESGMVASITEKPGPIAGWNLTGVLVLGEHVWPYIDGVEVSARGEYELPQAVTDWIAVGAGIAAVELDGPVFEIGSPQGLESARTHFSGESSSR